MRVINGRGHELWCFAAGVAKHQTLVAGANVEVVVRRMIHALGDVVGLLVVANHDRTAFVIDAVFGVVVANAFDGVACDLDVVHMRVGGDLACQNDQAGVGQCFGGHAAAGVLRKDGVKNGV